MNEGQLTVTKSTLSHNTALGMGGAGVGGGIMNEGQSTVTGSTLQKHCFRA